MDGEAVTAGADEYGLPPYRQCWDGVVYVREQPVRVLDLTL
jgi:hypothetical protein